jgi:N6-L-threonylcarbamoyladenine synthase
MDKMDDVKILAIESSCDETSAAVVRNGREVLSNVIYSQVDVHELYGGVVPEIASRNHIKKVSQIIDSALEEANLTLAQIDAVATTYGPGLVGALLVGMSTAKSLSYALDKPLVPVNHIEGHICSNFIEHPNLEPPLLALVVSGGHTHLVLMRDYCDFEVLGKTRDDASGEAFDKVARILGLGYPGGPKIDEWAKKGDKDAISFKRTLLEEGTLDFSFSGIKSAVLNYINSCKMKGIDVNKADVAASFQSAVIDVLVLKTLQAVEATGIDKVVLAGGVAANSLLRSELEKALGAKGVKFYYPSMELCTDNAAMIGCSGYYNFLRGERADMYLNAVPNLKIGQRYQVK